MQGGRRSLLCQAVGWSSTIWRELSGERVGNDLLPVVVPEVLHDVTVLGQILFEGLKHGVRPRFLPVFLQLAGEREIETGWAPAWTMRAIAASAS